MKQKHKQSIFHVNVNIDLMGKKKFIQAMME